MSLSKHHRILYIVSLILLISLGLALYSLSSIKPQPDALQEGDRFADNSSGLVYQGAGGFGGSGIEPALPGAGSHSNQPFGSSRDSSPEPQTAGADDISQAGGQYEVLLGGYALLFGVLFAVLFYLTLHGRLRLREPRTGLVTALLLSSILLLKIAAAPWISGYESDIHSFGTWSSQAAKNLRGFYLHSSSDYPPLYIYILYLIGRATASTATAPYFLLLLKLPSILADTATAYLLYRASRRYYSVETGLLIAAFYILNPAVIINSTFWGQADSLFTLLAAAAIWQLVRRRYGWAASLLTLAVLMKPQGLIYTPVLLFALVYSGNLSAWLRAAGASLLTAFAVALPFSAGQAPLWLLRLYTGTVNEYPYASVNAYNLFTLLGANYTKASTRLLLFSYHTWGMLFIVLATLFSGWIYRRSRSTSAASLGALMQIAGVFTFSASMHERYLFPAAALALLAYICWRDIRLLGLAFGFSMTTFLNTYAVYYGFFSQSSNYSSLTLTAPLANIAMCLFLGKIMLDLSGAAGCIRRMPR